MPTSQIQFHSQSSHFLGPALSWRVLENRRGPKGAQGSPQIFWKLGVEPTLTHRDRQPLLQDLGGGAGQGPLHSWFTHQSGRKRPLLLPAPIFGPNKLFKFPQPQKSLNLGALTGVTYILKIVSDCFPSTSAPGMAHVARVIAQEYSPGATRLLPFSHHSEGRVQPPHPHIRKDRKQVLQLLFIDIQVGSIATGLEAAAEVGEKEEGDGVSVCSHSPWSEGTDVHNEHGGSEGG